MPQTLPASEGKKEPVLDLYWLTEHIENYSFVGYAATWAMVTHHTTQQQCHDTVDTLKAKWRDQLKLAIALCASKNESERCVAILELANTKPARKARRDLTRKAAKTVKDAKVEAWRAARRRINMAVESDDEEDDEMVPESVSTITAMKEGMKMFVAAGRLKRKLDAEEEKETRKHHKQLTPPTHRNCANRSAFVERYHQDVPSAPHTPSPEPRRAHTPDPDDSEAAAEDVDLQQHLDAILRNKFFELRKARVQSDAFTTEEGMTFEEIKGIQIANKSDLKKLFKEEQFHPDVNDEEENG
ncbi:hypothetical protein HK097_006169 [Rhizophlyctis rosea]|uniref:Uncharacterized protein n=1 Tax=Rhizophlyctis rosea TaxID=64517 RepID=A0AAD5SJ33_9FUNG|nr:hypothetical protein HK097_006169 [Rhizophlyctis rosea]